MNKKLFPVILVLLLVLTLLFIGKVMVSQKEVILDQTTRILVLKGDVNIKKGGPSGEWRKADTSTIIEKGDTIETAEGASAEIIIGKNTEKALRVAGKSQLEFEKVNPAYLNLHKGKLLVKINSLESKSSFMVKTPTAICGAKGTAWAEEATSVSTTIAVFENKIFAQELTSSGRPAFKKHVIIEGIQRTVAKDKPISAPRKLSESELEEWAYWKKNISYLQSGKILINDFNKKENFNNIDGDFGSWNIFYGDENQRCQDEFSSSERVGDHGYSLKLIYDVDSPVSAYNGFFTKLLNIDLTDYKYLVFYVKGDKQAGFTRKLNLELKNKFEIGKTVIDGVTDKWRKMVIPLDEFRGLTSLKDMKELVIVFSDINATKKEGVIYIDDIYFSKEDPE